jgi:hypothetical protein
MTIGALESRYVAKVQRMLEGSVAFVTRGALPGVSIAEIDRMLEQSIFHSDRHAPKCLIDRSVTNAALVPNHLPVRTKMLAIVASEAALGVEVPDIVSVRLPIGLHFRKEISLIQPLHLDDRFFDVA